jgi:hypothetical protein
MAYGRHGASPLSQISVGAGMEIYLGRDGKSEGPFTLEQVRARIRSGELLPELCQVCPVGSQSWQLLRDFPGLRAHEAPGPEGLPAAPGVPAVPAIPAVAATPAPLPPVDGLGKLIPTRNPPALVGYYLSIFGLFPMCGLPLSVTALILGIMGIRRCYKQPGLPGIAHGWIATLLGGFMTLVGLVGIVAFFIAAAQA